MIATAVSTADAVLLVVDRTRPLSDLLRRFNQRFLCNIDGMPVGCRSEIAVNHVTLDADLRMIEFVRVYPNAVDWITALHYPLPAFETNDEATIKCQPSYTTVLQAPNGEFWSLVMSGMQGNHIPGSMNEHDVRRVFLSRGFSDIVVPAGYRALLEAL